MVGGSANDPLPFGHALEQRTNGCQTVGIVIHEQELFSIGAVVWHRYLVVAFVSQRLQGHLGCRGDIPVQIGGGARERLTRAVAPQAPESFSGCLPDIAISV